MTSASSERSDIRKSEGGREPAKILLVVENSALRGRAARLLRPFCEIVAAPDIRTALRTDLPDLLLSEAAQSLDWLVALRADPATRKLPVILISEDAGPCLDGAAAEANDFLIEPFSDAEFLARVRKQLTFAGLCRDASCFVHKRTEIAETALREARRRHTQAERSTGQGAWEYHPETGQISWSEPHYELFGLPETVEPSLEAWLAQIDVEDRARVEQELKSALKEKREHSIEFRITRGGETRWLASKGEVIHDTKGVARAIAGVSFDITERKRLEERLQQNELRLKVALEAAYLDSFEWDIQRNEVRRFMSAEPALPLMPDDARGTFEAVRDAVHPQDRDHFVARLHTAMEREDGLYEAEFRILRPGGVVIWVEEHGQVQRDADGRPARLIGVWRDITHRKKLEISEKEALEAARRSEEFALAILDSLPQQIAVLDENGAVRAVNAPWVLFLQQNGGAGTPIDVGADYFAPCRAAAAAGEASAVEALEGLNAICAGTRDEFRTEYPCHADRERWFLMHATRLKNQRGVIVSHFEITKRKQAEQALRESERRETHRASELKTILDTAPIGLAIALGADGRHIEGNKASGEMFGMARAAELSKAGPQPAAYIVVHEGRELAAEELPMQRAVRGEAVAGQIMEVRGEDGKSITVFAKASPLFDETGEPRGAVGAFLDITALKQAEAALRKSEENALRQRDELEWIYQNAPIGLCQLDLELRFLRINHWLAEINGLPAKAHIGRTVAEIVPQLSAAVEQVTKTILATGQAVRDHEFSGQTLAQPGVLRSWSESWYPVFDEGGSVKGFGVVVEETTERKRTEEALRESLDRYELVLAGAGDAIWDWDVLNHRAFFSPRWKELHGYGDAEIRDREEEWASSIHPGDSSRIIAAVKAHFEGKTEFFSEEYRIRCKDGSYKWVQDRGVARRNAAGRVVRMAGSERDITDRKRAEQALHESRTDLDRAQEVGQIGSWRLDVAKNILAWSDENYRIFGVPAGTPLTYETFLSIVHPGDRGYVDRCWKAALDGEPYDIEHRIVADGVVKWVREKAYLEIDSGVLRGGFGITQDITERKRAEEALRASEQRFRNVFEHAATGIAVADLQKRLLFANRSYCALLGYSEDELRALNFQELVHPDDFAGDLVMVERLKDETIPFFEIENRYVRKNGESVWVHKVVSLLRDDSGKPLNAVLLVTDVTERRRMEQELRDAGRRKDEFLATLAHELRNPLAPLGNGLQVLKRTGALRPEDEKLRAMMGRQVDHLVRLVSDLLDASRISSGKIELKKELAGIASIIAQAVEISTPAIERGGHELAVSAWPEPLTVDGDTVRLAQVFANLLNNAAKYTPDGGRIEISSRREGEEAVVRVRDNGVGVAAEMLPRIFDLFAQAESVRGRAQGGIGVGLTLARQLVQLHGGVIEARSEGLGRGSEFTVRLPPAAAAPEESKRESEPSMSTRRVLLADDNHDVADSLVLLLQCLGAEVQAAYDGATALEKLEEFAPDVIILDLGMPGMDGYETARRMRQTPQGRKALLMALTGWGGDEDRRRTREAGFDGHLVKPVDIDKLMNLMESGRIEG